MLFSEINESTGIPDESCIGCGAFGQCDQCYSCVNMGTCELSNNIPSVRMPSEPRVKKREVVVTDEEEHFADTADGGFLDSINNGWLIAAGCAAMITYGLYRYNPQVFIMYLGSRNVQIAMLVIGLLILGVVIWPHLGSETNIWENKDALESLNALVGKYGQPNILDSQAGGLAMWTPDQLLDTCFTRIEVRDEAVLHITPEDHGDHTYHYINYDISPEKFLDVTSLSGALVYDPMTKELRARCNSENHNIAILALATQIGEGNATLNFAQSNNMYTSWIGSTSKAENVKKLYELLCYNIDNQKGNPIPEGYWALALRVGS